MIASNPDFSLKIIFNIFTFSYNARKFFIVYTLEYLDCFADYYRKQAPFLWSNFPNLFCFKTVICLETKLQFFFSLSIPTLEMFESVLFQTSIYILTLEASKNYELDSTEWLYIGLNFPLWYLLKITFYCEWIECRWMEYRILWTKIFENTSEDLHSWKVKDKAKSWKKVD